MAVRIINDMQYTVHSAMHFKKMQKMSLFNEGPFDQLLARSPPTRKDTEKKINRCTHLYTPLTASVTLLHIHHLVTTRHAPSTPTPFPKPSVFCSKHLRLHFISVFPSHRKFLVFIPKWVSKVKLFLTRVSLIFYLSPSTPRLATRDMMYSRLPPKRASIHSYLSSSTRES